MLARPELSQTSLDLLATADLMKERGMAKRTRLHADGSVCLLGAIDLTITDWDRSRNAVTQLAKYIPETGRSDGWHIADYNNADERTLDECVAKLCEAAYGG